MNKNGSNGHAKPFEMGGTLTDEGFLLVQVREYLPGRADDAGGWIAAKLLICGTPYSRQAGKRSLLALSGDEAAAFKLKPTPPAGEMRSVELAGNNGVRFRFDACCMRLPVQPGKRERPQLHIDPFLGLLRVDGLAGTWTFSAKLV